MLDMTNFSSLLTCRTGDESDKTLTKKYMYMYVELSNNQGGLMVAEATAIETVQTDIGRGKPWTGI